MTRSLGDRRFQANVITRIIGAYALASVIKNNQARPVRRAIHWYTSLGASKKLDRARQALVPANTRTCRVDHGVATALKRGAC